MLFEEEWDPYAATPEDALNAARREVQRWRLQQIAHPRPSADLDPATAFVVFAWDTFKAPIFPYDEGLHLARSVGVDLDADVVGRLAEKKAGNLRLWDSAHRAAKGVLGPADGTRAMIDAIHHAANAARSRSLSAAQELLEAGGVDREAGFFVALEALLEVLPPSRKFTGVELKGDLAAAGDDFEALYDLYRLAYPDEIDEPSAARAVEGPGGRLVECFATATGSSSTRRTTAISWNCSTFRHSRMPSVMTVSPGTSTPARWRWPRGASRGWCATAV